jgi:hypothetical protein
MSSTQESVASILARKTVELLPNFFQPDSGYDEFQKIVTDLSSRRDDENYRIEFYSFLDQELQHRLEKHSMICASKNNPLECPYFRVYSQSLSYVRTLMVSCTL